MQADQEQTYVARTHSHQDHCRCAFPLRVACSILCLPGIYQWRDRRQARHQVVSEQEHPLLFSRDNNHQQGPNGGDERKPHDDQALALESSGEPAPTDDGKNLDNPEGDVEENGFKAVIPKGLDDEVAEGTDASAWD